MKGGKSCYTYSQNDAHIRSSGYILEKMKSPVSPSLSFSPSLPHSLILSFSSSLSLPLSLSFSPLSNSLSHFLPLLTLFLPLSHFLPLSLIFSLSLLIFSLSLLIFSPLSSSFSLSILLSFYPFSSHSLPLYLSL